jgi:dipeptidyl aminopeptidase/acylaminoacyl peptidase
VTSEIRTIRSEGGGTRVLHRETSGGTTIEDVTWDPDGARLLFTLGRLDGDAVDHPSLWSLAASGGRPHPLARRAQDADFSPDGDRIAFSSTADRTGKTCFEDCSFNGEIYVMDADGQAKRRLTHNRVDDVTPAWAPDGQRIAFSSDRNYETRYELFSIRPNGSCLTWLTNGTPDSSGPSWEPGARLSSDPGPCGAKSRKPLVGVPLASAHRFKRFRTWWLGKRTFSGLLLSDVFSERASLGFDYADCGFWRPVRCGAELQVDNESACGGEPHVLYGDDPRRLTRVKGALVYRLRGPDGGTDFYVGATIVSATVHKPRRVAAVANRLRRFDATSAPRRLPRAGFSRRVWRRYDRAARAVRKTGSVRRAAHALHKRPGQIRARVAMRRKLRRLGGRRLRC